MTKRNIDALKEQVRKIYPNDEEFKINALTTEGLITSQKIIQSAEEIKNNISQNQNMKASKLLLLCAELEQVYQNLMRIKHECNQ